MIWQILTYIDRVEAQTPGMQEEMQLNAQEIDLSKAHLDGVVAEDWLPDADKQDAELTSWVPE